jgi:8-oxo-dGTP pyrophosphatase MutT (NUDIX family)
MMAPETEIIPAATVVIFRQAASGPPELLMVQRSRAMRFAGGAVVFPGGKIDPADFALAAAVRPADDVELTASRIAAIRETLEETGLVIGVEERVSSEEAKAARQMLLADPRLEPVLQHFGWTLDFERLKPFARWCPQARRVFDTRFFVYDVGTGAINLTIDETENSRLFWSSAARSLELAALGEIDVIFPTRRNLERLAQFSTFEEVVDDIATHPMCLIRPAEIERDGEAWLQIPQGIGYPVTEERLATAMRG